MAESIAPAEEKTEHQMVLDAPDPNEEYASGARLAALIASLMTGMFLVALDNVSRIVAAVWRLHEADQTLYQTILSTGYTEDHRSIP